MEKRAAYCGLPPAIALTASLTCAACGLGVQGPGDAARAFGAGEPRAGISILAAGDVLLTRLPGERMRNAGFDSLMAGIEPLVEAADISFANLECPISTRGSPYPQKPVNVTFRASPEAAFSLREAGFDVVSLANNHMSDYGAAAVAETLRYLDLIGIEHTGAGRGGSEARRAAIARKGGYSVAFLAYVEPMWSVVEARDPPWPAPLATIGPDGVTKSAGPGRPGTAVIRDDTLMSDIASLRARGDIDIIAVSFHWGEEIAAEPNAYQRKFARMAIDGGADIVLGHHPHVLQGVERYKDGLILYSLGNLVFDMREDSTFDSLAAIVRLGRETSGKARIETLELVPLRIARGSWAPSPAIGQDRRRITDYLRERSKNLGLELRLGGVALLEGERWLPGLSWTRDLGP